MPPGIPRHDLPPPSTRNLTAASSSFTDWLSGEYRYDAQRSLNVVGASVRNRSSLLQPAPRSSLNPGRQPDGGVLRPAPVHHVRPRHLPVRQSLRSRPPFTYVQSLTARSGIAAGPHAARPCGSSSRPDTGMRFAFRLSVHITYKRAPGRRSRWWACAMGGIAGSARHDPGLDKS